jgi:hypothetical protein
MKPILSRPGCQKVFLKSFASFGQRSGDNRPVTGSLVLDGHGARDEHRDDQVPKVSEAFGAALLELC